MQANTEQVPLIAWLPPAMTMYGAAATLLHSTQSASGQVFLNDMALLIANATAFDITRKNPNASYFECSVRLMTAGFLLANTLLDIHTTLRPTDNPFPYVAISTASTGVALIGLATLKLNALANTPSHFTQPRVACTEGGFRKTLSHLTLLSGLAVFCLGAASSSYNNMLDIVTIPLMLAFASLTLADTMKSLETPHHWLNRLANFIAFSAAGIGLIAVSTGVSKADLAGIWDAEGGVGKFLLGLAATFFLSAENIRSLDPNTWQLSSIARPVSALWQMLPAISLSSCWNRPSQNLTEARAPLLPAATQTDVENPAATNASCMARANAVVQSTATVIYQSITQCLRPSAQAAVAPAPSAV